MKTLEWTGEALLLLDQRLLPGEVVYVRCETCELVTHAISDMVVRGAPAIGVAAAYAMALAAAQVAAAGGSRETFLEKAAALSRARPTAVNLMWAVDRMLTAMPEGPINDGSVAILQAEAARIEQEDVLCCQRIGQYGNELIQPGDGILTHCNAGALATAGIGTALGVIRAAHAAGKNIQVYADETRPYLQGARLTVWELQQDGIDATLIADSAASHLMKTGAVQWVIVGADRICANGDTANKIGTYQLAIAARHHGVKFMVVAPSSTVDMDTVDGSQIEIEQRDPGELYGVGGTRTVAEGIAAWNPVFDVTPGELIDAIVTERGVILNPTVENMRAAFGG